jgi:hypothetical protein
MAYLLPSGAWWTQDAAAALQRRRPWPNKPKSLVNYLLYLFNRSSYSHENGDASAICSSNISHSHTTLLFFL